MSDYALVYQNGIANVFRYSEGRVTVFRVMQSDFRTCEAFAAGLLEAGANVEVRHCDEMGDIAKRPWPAGVGTIYPDKKCPPLAAVYST